VQHHVVPELAHTQTRPLHWVATATALAGVVALSSVLEPKSATAKTPEARPQHRPAVAAPAPDPSGVAFPLDCGPVEAVVVKKASGDLDGDRRPETVVTVHCDAPMGTPPDGVYVLTQAAGAKEPRLIATLLDPKDTFTVKDLSVTDGTVVAELLGYSDDSVPRCCPDVSTTSTWTWRNGAFVQSVTGDARNV
jgi:hypothetical protein